jgi:hypothetical protein
VSGSMTHARSARSTTRRLTNNNLFPRRAWATAPNSSATAMIRGRSEPVTSGWRVLQMCQAPRGTGNGQMGQVCEVCRPSGN